MDEREELLKKYRNWKLRELLEARFYGSHDPSTIEQVILEKADAFDAFSQADQENVKRGCYSGA